jgi:hypothetical protein
VVMVGRNRVLGRWEVSTDKDARGCCFCSKLLQHTQQPHQHACDEGMSQQSRVCIADHIACMTQAGLPCCLMHPPRCRRHWLQPHHQPAAQAHTAWTHLVSRAVRRHTDR